MGFGRLRGLTWCEDHIVEDLHNELQDFNPII